MLGLKFHSLNYSRWMLLAAVVYQQYSAVGHAHGTVIEQCIESIDVADYVPEADSLGELRQDLPIVPALRDAIALLLSPEYTNKVQAVYVNDMGKFLLTMYSLRCRFI